MKDQYREKLNKNMMWFNRIMNNINKEEQNMQIQESGERWTAIQLLRHIAYSESSITKLIDDIIAGKDEVQENYSLNDINTKAQDILKDKDMNSIQARMDKSRNATLELLEKISDDDWTKEGRYFTGDVVSVKQIFEILIWHQSHHGKQITDKLDTSGWS